MFFLLPVIAGAAATAISAGEVAAGIAGAAGIGAAIKGAIDTKQASDIRKSAGEKYGAESGKLRAEALRTQRKAEEFGRMKKEIYSGILKKFVGVAAGGGTGGADTNPAACA